MSLTIRDLELSADIDLLCGWLHDDRPGSGAWSRSRARRSRRSTPGCRSSPIWLRTSSRSAGRALPDWDPEVDELGTFYDRRPGDIVHLFLADTPIRKGRTEEILEFFIDKVISKSGARRAVVEPDASNEASSPGSTTSVSNAALSFSASAQGRPVRLLDLP